MRKITATVILAAALLSAGHPAAAQTKTGCISFNELLSVMPEYKKADTTLGEFRNALAQQFETYKAEYNGQGRLLSSKDTAKYTKVQLEVKRKSLMGLLAKLQGYEQEAGQQLDQKRQALLAPIHKKAADAIQDVAKENGYGFVIEKDALHAYPPSDDILPLVKKKLGMR
jgi:outer membrane protein